jgi:cysteinyl-tRNA synthetase
MGITVLYDLLKADIGDFTKAAVLKDFDRVLSLDLGVVKEEEKSEEDEAFAAWVEEQIALRAAAKKEKNYAEADRIRELLKEQGVALRDSREGTSWEKIS